MVQMHRKTGAENVDEFNPHKMEAELIELKRKCIRWAQDNIDSIKAVDPVMPRELINRERDKWRPLIAIAEVVEGNWLEKARKIALLLSSASSGLEENSLMVQLLSDVRDLFDESGKHFLASAYIEFELKQMEDRPWPEFRNGNPITTNKIAKLLAPFGIKPDQLWTDGKKVRGYERADFEDVFLSYLPPIQTVEAVEPNDGKALRQHGEVVGMDSTTVSNKAQNPRQQGILPDLPDQARGHSGELIRPKSRLLDVSQVSDKPFQLDPWELEALMRGRVN